MIGLKAEECITRRAGSSVHFCGVFTFSSVSPRVLSLEGMRGGTNDLSHVLPGESYALGGNVESCKNPSLMVYSSSVRLKTLKTRAWPHVTRARVDGEWPT